MQLISHNSCKKATTNVHLMNKHKPGQSKYYINSLPYLISGISLYVYSQPLYTILSYGADVA